MGQHVQKYACRKGYTHSAVKDKVVFNVNLMCVFKKRYLCFKRVHFLFTSGFPTNLVTRVTYPAHLKDVKKHKSPVYVVFSTLLVLVISFITLS